MIDPKSGIVTETELSLPNFPMYYVLSRSPFRTLFSVFRILGLGFGFAVLANSGLGAPETKKEPGPGTYQRMEYGPVMGESIIAEWPKDNVALKGLAVRLNQNTAMVFDTDLLRWSAATVDGWVDLSKTSRTSYKGSSPARTEGRQVFGTGMTAGWAQNGRFEGAPEVGPLPKDWAHWRGFYQAGEQVLLFYTVGETEVWESPSAVEVDGGIVFIRDIFTSGSASALSVRLTDLPEEVSRKQVRGGLQVEGAETGYFFAIESSVEGVNFREGENGQVEVDIPAHAKEGRIRLVMAELPEDSTTARQAVLQAAKKVQVDREAILSGGPQRWQEEVVTETKMGQDDSAYVVDSIGLPMENPWDSWIRPTGFGFFEDGTRLAMSTWNGDIWIASGLGKEDLGEVRWKRFATGLYFPLGVLVVDERVYVTERGQLTRLHDLNGDGEADFYENFNNDGELYRSAHSLELDVDSQGNFYFYKNGNRVPEGVPDHGTLMRVSADGAHRQVVANGIRGSNALGIGPNDVILGADQQGNWVPTARVDWLRDGRFYGYRPHGGQGIPVGEFEPPVCWIPHKVDNSTGSIVYAGDKRWGPLSDHWVLTSYAQGSMMVLYTEMKGEQMQGGVVRLPLDFSSGTMRARISGGDGQLYIMGMKGWGTLAQEDGSFDRVRYTGKPSDLPVALHVSPEGIRVSFSEKLDPATVQLEDFDVKRWAYLYTSSYGSPEVSAADPEKQGRDEVTVTSVTLEADGKTVFLEIPDMAPVMQMMVGYRIGFADGGRAENAVYHTIHRLTDEKVAKKAGEESGEIASAEEEQSVENEEPEPGDAWGPFVGGRDLYTLNCSSCHQSAGRFGIAPDLGKSDWVAGSPDALVRILLHGKEGEQGMMMPFAQLSDTEIATLLSYLRTRWHDQDPISPEHVEEIREAEADRTAIWKESELKELSRNSER